MPHVARTVSLVSVMILAFLAQTKHALAELPSADTCENKDICTVEVIYPSEILILPDQFKTPLPVQAAYLCNEAWLGRKEETDALRGGFSIQGENGLWSEIWQPVGAGKCRLLRFSNLKLRAFNPDSSWKAVIIKIKN